ncbi:unnamed protein product [Cuscuta epithymum]|uniref:BRX domain-containing protein n=1 Tax=Cuscuta epithymum TaxID=186058 RepID=A0AAV0DZ56_9ASTE|nr:unnamed protein product [Cuscuta epithymum]CAH9131185.1 unnamed protein product [Cuscuta epithymum]
MDGISSSEMAEGSQQDGDEADSVQEAAGQMENLTRSPGVRERLIEKGTCSDKDGWVVSMTDGRQGKRNLLRLVYASIHPASTIIVMVRPPPEPPPEVERGARVHKFYFAYIVFFMFHFYLDLYSVFGFAVFFW